MSDMRFEGPQQVFNLYQEQPDGTHAKVMMLPADLFTGDNAAYRRLRVDPGQTGFFAGREFRVFQEFSVGSGLSQVWRFDATQIEFILQHVAVQCWESAAKFELLAEGGTEGGTFATPVATRRTNRMITADLTYASQMVVSTGGTYTGGVVTESTELNTGSGSGRHHEAANDTRPYGVPKGVYYLKVTAIGGTARGAINVRWEERP